jgi:hypothetical protein
MSTIFKKSKAKNDEKTNGGKTAVKVRKNKKIQLSRD